MSDLEGKLADALVGVVSLYLNDDPPQRSLAREWEDKVRMMPIGEHVKLTVDLMSRTAAVLDACVKALEGVEVAADMRAKLDELAHDSKEWQ